MNTPLPGQHLVGRSPSPSVDTDPGEIRRVVEDILHRVDELQTAASQTDGESAPAATGAHAGELAALGRQAALLEQAHQVLVDALFSVDRA